MIQAGQILNERYKLIKPLGQGSQAAVWVAEHLALRSQVAVKLIDPELAKQADAIERFTREATAAAKLRSAHVVQIMDHGVEGDQPFIVMELLEGEDLFDRLEKRRRLTLLEVSKIVTQIARALSRAHAEGIIHRDLKPENVFLVKNEDDEIAKVLDFGVAKVMAPAKAAMTKTGVGTLIGTPHYMSPEQVKGLTEIDHHSDLWSLAVIAYQCVTGELPFDSEGVGDLLIRITMDDPKPPSKIEASLPPEFDAWFKKGCAKDPTKRFDTAREMATALAQAAGVASQSQRGAAVDLGDSQRLDWASLAAVRAPDKPMSVFPGGLGEDIIVDMMSRPPPAMPAETIDSGWDDEGDVAPPQKPPIAGSVNIKAAAQASSTAPPVVLKVPPSGAGPKPEAELSAVAEPQPPRPSSPGTSSPGAASPGRKAPTPPSPRSNPFLEEALAPSARAPSSGRGLQSTVTGLASSSRDDLDFPTGAEGSRRRRGLWYVGLVVVVAGVAVTAGVIQSRGGFEEIAAGGSAGPARSTAPSAKANAATPPRPLPKPRPSASAATSGDALDPEVTKKPTNPPASTAPVGGPRPRPTKDGDDVVIDIPLPDQPAPRRR